MKFRYSSKQLLSAFLTITVCSLVFSVTAYADAENTCTVNDNSFNCGDTLTYTLKIKSASDKFSGINVSLYYDPSCLELDAGRISVPVFSNAIFTSEPSGEIRFSAINAAQGYDLRKGGTVIAAPFKIKSGAKEKTDITFSIKEAYGMDIENNEGAVDFETQVEIKNGENDERDIVAPQNIDEIERELSDEGNSIKYKKEEPAKWTAVGISAAAVIVLCVAAVFLIYKKRHK